MGRHTAADGDPVHPVVAAALARRTSDPAGIHHGNAARGDGGLGWPGEPAPGGGGLGWPGDLDTTRPVGPVTDEAQRPQQADDEDRSGDDEADDDRSDDHRADDDRSDDDQAEDRAPQLDPAGRRRGWRRLLGARAA